MCLYSFHVHFRVILGNWSARLSRILVHLHGQREQFHTPGSKHLRYRGDRPVGIVASDFVPSGDIVRVVD